MNTDYRWQDQLDVDLDFGFKKAFEGAPRRFHPQIVLNSDPDSVLRALRDELKRCTEFAFSVAFVTPRAIALLKQELVEFGGTGRIITSDYLSFNSPAAFAELWNLRRLGIDVRVHSSTAFHPKGYVFSHVHTVTAMIGSSNLTENALARNTEWNLKVSAARGSDLARQLTNLINQQVEESQPLTPEWIDQYAANYHPPRSITPVGAGPRVREDGASTRVITPNAMQADALEALKLVRESGERRAVVISATGTGKTILSALDVREVQPERMLFLVHREQILDRTISEYRDVLGGPASDFGKLAGSTRETNAKYLFATIQSFSRPEVLGDFAPAAFDHVIIDEAHRAAAPTYQRVLNHLQPKFLLGMTATPERTDESNVFEIFDYNVPYEIRLNHALEHDMLSPFHYYGVTDVTYADGESVTADADLSRLVTPERVDHVIRAIETYGQAGVAPCGLIFCARIEEARLLADALNTRTLRGRELRTQALAGSDSVEVRREAVARLEAGELDYLLTVDIFNEGVDIPSINQVIMLRQTQSAIVFVQQLGRGLRKASGKDYLVVIDFIGNYANNYLIPIALFGDSSLNKESLRKNLIAAEEIGVLPGLSSIRFDRIAQARVLESLAQTRLDSMSRLKSAILDLRQRLGRAPLLWDSYRFESVDPIILATKVDHYPQLLSRLRVQESTLTETEHKYLQLLSHEVLPAKRLHEFVMLSALLERGELTAEQGLELLVGAGVAATERQVHSVFDTLTVTDFPQQLTKKYAAPIASRDQSGKLRIDPGFAAAMGSSQELQTAVADLLHTGQHLTLDRYGNQELFNQGRQYTRKDVTRLLSWPRAWASTLYGYRADPSTGYCPIFVTLHKPEDTAHSTAYEDALLDNSTMRWFTRSRRTLQSPEVAAIVSGQVELHVFVQKDNADDFFYLGQASAAQAEPARMPGVDLDVVTMLLRFANPIEAALYDYFHPLLT